MSSTGCVETLGEGLLVILCGARPTTILYIFHRLRPSLKQRSQFYNGGGSSANKDLDNTRTIRSVAGQVARMTILF